MTSNSTTYLNLSMGAKRRLDYLKRYAQRHNEKHQINHMTGKPMVWQEARHSGFYNAHAGECRLSKGGDENTPIWYCHTGAYFDREQWADDVLGLRHTGWFADDMCSNTIRGFVVLLSHGRYLAGYYESDNGERVYYPDVYDDIEQAARDADHYAEQNAELLQEDNRKYHEALALSDDLESQLARLRECLALRNNPCFKHLRKEAERLLESIRDTKETLATSYVGYL